MANNNKANYPGGAGNYQTRGKRPPQHGYATERDVQNLRRVQERVGNGPRQMHIPIPPPESQYRQSASNGFRNTASSQSAATRRKARNLQQQMGTKPNPAGRVYGYSVPSDGRRTPPKNPPRRPQTRPASQWAVPEGSAVYTSKGVYYNGRQSHQGNKDNYSARRKQQAAAKKAEKAKIKAEKRKKTRLYAKTFFATLGVVFVLCCAAVGLIYNSTFSASGDNAGNIDYTLRIGKKYYLSGDGNQYSGGIAYINFSDFAECFGMASVGSVDSMRFIIPCNEATDSSGSGHEEYVIFTDSVRCATVNGTDVIMEGPCRTSGLSFRIPLSFIEHYFNGIVLEKSADGSDITVSPEKEKTDDEGNIVIPEISFSISKSDTLSHISYPS